MAHLEFYKHDGDSRISIMSNIEQNKKIDYERVIDILIHHKERHKFGTEFKDYEAEFECYMSRNEIVVLIDYLSSLLRLSNDIKIRENTPF